MEKMKEKKVGATLGMHLSVRYDLRTKRRTCLHFIYSFSIKGFWLFLFLSFFIFISFFLSCWLTIRDTTTQLFTESWVLFILSYFFLPSILGRCERFVHVSVIPHHSLIPPWSREVFTHRTKKKRSPMHKIGEWRIIILLFHYMGGFFFFFFACLLAYRLVYLFESLRSWYLYIYFYSSCPFLPSFSLYCIWIDGIWNRHRIVSYCIIIIIMLVEVQVKVKMNENRVYPLHCIVPYPSIYDPSIPSINTKGQTSIYIPCAKSWQGQLIAIASNSNSDDGGKRNPYINYKP